MSAATVRAHLTGGSIPHTPGTFGIAIDTREQHRFKFDAYVPWVTSTLVAGDYAPIGHETEIAVERKSLADLFGSVTRDNARFQRELEKLAHYKFAAVVIEASQREALHGIRYSKVPGTLVLRACASLEVKYRVPFHFGGDRAGATIWTYTLLEAAFRRAEAEKSRAAKEALQVALTTEVQR